MFVRHEPADGFYPLEHDDEGPFQWTRQTFTLRMSGAARFAKLRLCYLGDSGRLKLHHAGNQIHELRLGFGWHDYLVALPSIGAASLTARVDPLISVAADTRELGVMLRDLELFDDERRFETLVHKAANAVLNEIELRAGRAELQSHPPHLRINMEGRCNLPETGQACTYCHWDLVKQREQGSPAFGLQTLTDLGDFYRCASHINDCSVGEPTMNKQFNEIVAAMDSDDKHLSFTCNGQLLVENRRRAVLGKNATLYVSVDSATAEGYRRYRNDRFDDLIANLRALCRDKRQHGNLPTVYVAFIVMRSNRDELPEFFDLMADVGVDAIKLRTLYLNAHEITPPTVNNGYAFDYLAEVLSLEELERLTPWAHDLAAARGVAVHCEWHEFGKEEESQAGLPICAEPWKTLYVLRRGIFPCSFASKPIARWNEQGDRPLEQFLGDVYNGPVNQALRAELSAGRLPQYCQDSPSCPITKRMLSRQPAFASEWSADDAMPMLPMVSLESLTQSRAA